MKLLSITAGVLALAGIACGQTAAEVSETYRKVSSTLRLSRGQKFSPSTLIVRYKDGASESTKKSLRTQTGTMRLHRYRMVPNMEVVYVPSNIESTATALRKNPSVAAVYRDLIVRAANIPNDTDFGLLYGMNQAANNDINAPQAWQVFTGSQNFPIAIIDSGIDITHPDLADNLWQNPNEVLNGIDDDENGYIDDIHGWDFVHEDPVPDDEFGHGSHCAGTLGAVGNNMTGVAGVNWACSIMALKFFDSTGEGLVSNAVRAIEYSIYAGAKVSSNSWFLNEYYEPLYFAVGATEYYGQVFCACAGNAGIDLNNPWYTFDPAEYPFANVLGVASTNETGSLSSFSNYGNNIIDIAAPGSNIYSTMPGGLYAYMSGTSMATPHVAGAAALVYAQNSTWTPAQVVDRLLRTARPRTEFGLLVTGGRFLDVGAAVTGPKPIVTVSAPLDGATVTQGANVTFTATAVDPEDGNVAASLVWLSNLQGQIGTGASFVKNNLVVGKHYVRAAGVDSSGLIGAAGFTITVNAPPPPPPSAPTGVSATKIAAGMARVNWTDTSNNETGFDIQRETKSGSSWINQTIVGSVGANVTQFNNNAGINTFRYRVRSKNAGGTSAWSAWAQVKL